jgi:hypothetical protein
MKSHQNYKTIIGDGATGVFNEYVENFTKKQMLFFNPKQ